MRGLILFSVLALSGAALAQEVAVPDKPVTVTVTSYRVVGFSQEREPDWRLVITYADSTGKVYRDEHVGLSTRPNPKGGQPLPYPEGAEALVKQLNTANLSTVSLNRRLLQHLMQHNKIPTSTLSGTPETP